MDQVFDLKQIVEKYRICCASGSGEDVYQSEYKVVVKCGELCDKLFKEFVRQVVGSLFFLCVMRSIG